MDDNIKLENLKKQIKDIDYEILILIKRRLKTIKKITEFKIKNNFNLSKSKFEQELTNELMKNSSLMDLNQKFILDMFEEIDKESNLIKKEISLKLQKNDN